MRILDLFCCAGGAAAGYARAGFDVVGVDVVEQPNYPFTFVKADAVTFAREHGHEFDAAHASPPCQAHTQLSVKHRGKNTIADTHLNLIPATREALAAIGLPFVLENVYGATTHLRNPVRLTGELFGLGVHRPRLFETNWPLHQPKLPPKNRSSLPVYGKLDGRRLWTRKDGTELRAPKTIEQAREAMGISWMTWEEIREAIPPRYTHFIGLHLMAHLLTQRKAA